MLTYNIWFSAEKMRERMEALGQIVEDLQPDILVFQEVTRENLAILEEQTWFSRYRLIPSGVKMQEKPRHFVIILIVYAVEKWFIHPFVNSPRMRKLVVAQTRSAVSPGLEFVVAGTHLVHAEENTIQREQQLKESLKILSPYENVCVMGDMNIEDKVDGDIVLPSPWIDAWLSLPGNTDSNGLTYDRSKTPFAPLLKRTVNATTYKARLDRVLCKLSDFKVKEMRVVGEKLAKSGIRPSDHFGVFTVTELSLPSDGSLAHGRTRSRVPDEISMLTYNIWRSPEKMRERIVALGQIVDDLEPDILVFQEVTLENLVVLKEQRWFARYRLIPPDVTVQGTISLEIILIMYPAVQKWYISRFGILHESENLLLQKLRILFLRRFSL
ncbi:unnamed protein product [Porites evermanni]|uniref:Endonuclease/exonuclease/phosphatase domain-containing protein n=1 Tax=Porites evermanni TaxID=104178 RepID=A0ABN8QE10_9CNID|nr:unnamed protein product [Porites evermanni]